MAKPLPLTPFDRRKVATSAGCDPGCVVRFLRGEAVRSTTKKRIETAIRNLGLDEQLAAAGAST